MNVNNFAGDVNGDSVVNYTDLCMMASHILQMPIQHELCPSPLIGATSIPPNMIQYGDIDGDGDITILDLVSVVNILVYQIFDSGRDINDSLIRVQNLFEFAESITSGGDVHGTDGRTTPTRQTKRIQSLPD